MQRYPLGVLAVGALILAACGAPKEKPAEAPPSAAMAAPSAVGMYTGDAAGKKLTLVLATSGEAEFTAGDAAALMRGTYSATGDDVTVTLAPADPMGQPLTLTFKLSGDALTPAQWDSALGAGPSKLTKAS